MNSYNIFQLDPLSAISLSLPSLYLCWAVHHNLFEDNHPANILSTEGSIHQIPVSAVWRQGCREGQCQMLSTNPGGWQVQVDFSALW